MENNVIIAIIALYVIIITLIFAVSFLYIYVLEKDDVLEENSVETVLISLKDIAFTTFLQKDQNEQDLISFYEDVNDDPYIDIRFTYITPPDNLIFRVLNSDRVQVSGVRTIVSEKEGYSLWRYPFVNDGSDYYTLQYTLSALSTNLSNVTITRVEVLGR
jgi:hypothetical protein